MKITSNGQSSKNLRTYVVKAVCAASMISGLTAPMAVQAQPAKAEAPMAAHAMPAGGMDHGADMKAMMKGMNDKMASMAKMELKHGKDASMRKMAQEVIKAQKKEIATIDRFLAKNGSPAKGS
jgi:uncharacterized protein (DUF305 family)